MSIATPEFLESLRAAEIAAPELHTAAYEISERLRALEAELVAPGKSWSELRLADYTMGSATKPDGIWVRDVPGTLVVASADHATNMFKRSILPKGDYIRADHGTGAQVMLLAEQAVASSVAPRGWQSWNVAVSDDAHPVKEEIRKMLPSRRGFLSVHGMYSGKVRHLSDPGEVHAVIGLGANPNDISIEAAHNLVRAGQDMGLSLSIANEESLYQYDPVTGLLKTQKDTGEPDMSCLSGAKPAMTNALAYRIMEETKEQKVSMQLELAAFLRLRALDDDGGWHRDERARQEGTYLGYMLVKAAAELAIQSSSGRA